MWKEIGKACEWRYPCTPSVRLLWDGKVTGAVLKFLRTTRVGCLGTERVPPEEEEGENSERRREGWAPLRFCFFLHLSFAPFVPSVLLHPYGTHYAKELRMIRPHVGN